MSFGRIQRLTVDLAGALHADQAVSAVVFDRARDPGIDGEFLRGEELFAIDLAIDDPAIDEAFAARVGHGHGLEVMVLLEIADRRSSPSRVAPR